MLMQGTKNEVPSLAVMLTELLEMPMLGVNLDPTSKPGSMWFNRQKDFDR